jgi:Peptidase family M23
VRQENRLYSRKLIHQACKPNEKTRELDIKEENMILYRPIDLKCHVTQRFGENPQNYEATHGHNGIDYGAQEGTPIKAAADGIVSRAELDTATALNPKIGYGFHVRLLHPNNTMTIYAHFVENGIMVSTGQNVKMGEVIGRSGNTGMSTGPHLHFELRTGISLTTSIDPEPLIVNELPPEAGLFDVTVTPEGDYLNIRLGPSAERGRVRILRSGDKVRVFGFAGKDAWLMTQEGYIKYDPTWERIEIINQGGA